MHSLYARFVLWLIRPALGLRTGRNEELRQAIVDAVVCDLRRNGELSQAIRLLASPVRSVSLLNREGFGQPFDPARRGNGAQPPQRSEGQGEAP